MADQSIQIKCPNLTCRRILAVPATSRGKIVKCKACGGVIRVPAKGAPVSSGEHNKPADKAA